MKRDVLPARQGTSTRATARSCQLNEYCPFCTKRKMLANRATVDHHKGSSVVGTSGQLGMSYRGFKVWSSQAPRVALVTKTGVRHPLPLQCIIGDASLAAAAPTPEVLFRDRVQSSHPSGRFLSYPCAGPGFPIQAHYSPVPTCRPVLCPSGIAVYNGPLGR